MENTDYQDPASFSPRFCLSCVKGTYHQILHIPNLEPIHASLQPKTQSILHLGGHSVSLTGEEPRVLTPVVGSEVQNDPYA